MIVIGILALGFALMAFGLLSFGTGRFIDPGQGYDNDQA